MKYQILALSLTLAALGCGDDSTPTDAGADSAVTTDAGSDAATDAATDSAMDAGGDAATDAGSDAAMDAATDSGMTTDAGGDAAMTPSCPADPPTDGAACSATQSCDWLRCTSSGHTAASCDGSTWTVSNETCGTFTCEGGASSGTCTGDQVCRQDVGGAFLADCQANPCGDMPLEKSCACTGCAPENCTISGRTVTCNTCPSGLCP